MVLWVHSSASWLLNLLFPLPTRLFPEFIWHCISPGLAICVLSFHPSQAVLLLCGSPTKRLVRRMRIFLSLPVTFSASEAVAEGSCSSQTMAGGVSTSLLKCSAGQKYRPCLESSRSPALCPSLLQSLSLRTDSGSPCTLPSPNAAHSCSGSGK